MSERRSPFDSIDFGSFEREMRDRRRPTADEIDRTSTLPRREPRREPKPMRTLGVTGEPAAIDVFVDLCKRERRSYIQMIQRLMEVYENRGES